eukprot:1157021-Pelagomonas_calceolata.AAC.5
MGIWHDLLHHGSVQKGKKREGNIGREALLHQLRKRRHIGSKEQLVPSITKQEQKGLLGTWMVAGSTQLQNLAERN